MMISEAIQNPGAMGDTCSWTLSSDQVTGMHAFFFVISIQIYGDGRVSILLNRQNGYRNAQLHLK